MKKGFLRTFVLCFLAFQMVFSQTAFANEDEPTPAESIPTIILLDGPIFELQPGIENEVKITIKNTSSFTAKSIVVQPVITDADSPFTISFKSDSNKISALAPKSEKTVTLLVNVDKTAASKTYGLELNYTFFNTYSLKYTGSDKLYFKIQNSTAVPNLMLENYSLSPGSVDAGGSAVLSATIRNKGTLDMYDVNISLSGLDAGKVSVAGANNQRFSILDAGTASDFSFNVVTNSNMDTGSYPVTVNVAYKDITGTEYTFQQEYYINVGGSLSSARPLVEIINMAEPSGTYGVNSNFAVKFDLVNNGDGIAKNIKITAQPAGGDGSVVSKSASIQTLTELTSGGSKSFEFLFAATSASESQNYPIEFSVEYEDGTKVDGANKIVTYKQYAGVNVNNPDSGDKSSKPKIIVSNYVCDPIIVAAGKNFDLTMTFMNTHSDKNVKNIKMYLTLSEETSSDTEKTGNIFTPVNSSNTFYFDSIPSKSTVDKMITLYVVPDAKPKTYTLTVNFEYEDESGTEYTAQELLGINVAQPVKFETSQIYLPETIETGMPINVFFELYNTGNVTLNNLMIKLEGDIDTQNASTYMGNFESGYSEYFDGTFYIYNEGENKVSVIISYDDSNGERIEEVQEFTVVGTAPYIPEEGDLMEPPEQAGLSVIQKVLIGTTIAVCTAVILLIVIKKRKQKKEEAFLASDDEYGENAEVEQDENDKFEV